MFEQYPKTRPILTDEYKNIYIEHYKVNRAGASKATSLAQRMERWMHHKVAADLKGKAEISPTLEIGAGTLNHLPYEKETEPYDIVEPFKELFSSSDKLKRIRNIYGDISEIPISEKYARILSIATFEHILDLPKTVAKAGSLLAKDGHLRIGIPNEGTVLWKMGWKFTTGLEFKLKHKLDYEVLMKYEHVNSADEIEEVLNFFFSSVKCKVLGLSKKLAFYRFYDCSKPQIEHCLKFVK